MVNLAVFLTIQRASFDSNGAFEKFTSSNPEVNNMRLVENIDLLPGNQVPLSEVLNAVLAIIEDSSNSQSWKEKLAVKVGQGVNIWKGKFNLVSNTYSNEGRKSGECIVPLMVEQFIISSDHDDNMEKVSVFQR
jgi:hypothetical protein